jgi:arylsulfatase A-like enzyme
MRSTIHLFLISLGLALLVARPAAVQAGTAAASPNIVFFFTDDQAYDTTGCYGNPDVRTPHIDQLATRGMVFDRHYDTTAICMASRASVMTGMYEYKTGCNFMHGPLGRDQWLRSYPVLLRQAGYRTAFGGKFGFAVVDDPRQGGSEGSYENLPLADFDFWVGGTGQTSYVTRQNKYLARYADQYPHSTRAYGAAGRDFVRASVAARTPFCLTLFFKAPHRPTTPDPMFDDVYRETVFRKLPNYGRAAGEHLAPQSRLGRQYPRFVEWGYHTEETWQQAMRIYHQQIYGVDYAIGMVLEELQRQGVADNTVIIFSSDNGFFNGSHGLGSKVLPYEEGARVPLIICDPRIPAVGGRRTGAVTGNVDIAATIVDLAGLDVPPNMDGKSLMPIVRGTAPRVRDTLPVIQVWGTAGTLSLAVVTETHKYVHWIYGQDVQPAEELFDLVRDPYEMRNVARDAEYRLVLETMRDRYDAEVQRWREQAVDYNDYQPFGTLFDRAVPWNEKKHLLPKQFR